MAIFDSIRMGAAGAGGDYEVERSLRFNTPDSAYLERTPSSASSRTTWTLSFWVKRSLLGVTQGLFCTNGSDNNTLTEFMFASGNNLIWSAQSKEYWRTTRVFRDTNAWYHIVIVCDTTNSTQADRQPVYINGVRETSFSTQNLTGSGTEFGFNRTVAHQIGRRGGGSDNFSGYMAEINFIDGQALTPSSFAETNSITGQWNPIDTSGLTFGTNGYRLKFADNSGTSATTLGKDTSGNSNNYTPNNFSVSAGQGNDSVTDTPTNNFCTLNPLAEVTNGNVTTSNGNLDAAFGSVSGGGGIGSSHVVRSGKWYWETTMTADSGGACHIGVLDENLAAYSGVQYYEPGLTAESYSYQTNGKTYNNNANQNYGASYTTGDVIGTKLDLDNGTIEFLKNNSSQGVAFTGLTGGFLPAYGDGNSAQTHALSANFGQRAFSYTIPTGYKTLCSANLPDPAILLPNKHFGTILYSGNSSTQTISDTDAVDFTPDWVWVKRRNGSNSHILTDVLRGVLKYLVSSDTTSELTNSVFLSAFVNGGFSSGNNGDMNGSGRTYVAWNWNAGGSTVTNNNGSISSQVRANATAGFSIVTYTGTGNNATVGHGLGVAPKAYIIKRRDSGSGNTNWRVYHEGLNDGSNPEQFHLKLNSSDSQVGQSNIFNDTAPTSTVFSIGTHASTGENSGTFVAYVFSEVVGYSKFGKYVGNGSTDGQYLYTGFRPAFLIVKNRSASRDWLMFDNKRSPSNVINDYLFPSLNEAEGVDSTTIGIDFTANGFKWRGSSSGNNYINSSGDHFVYFAFAESPFKHSRAR